MLVRIGRSALRSPPLSSSRSGSTSKKRGSKGDHDLRMGVILRGLSSVWHDICAARTNPMPFLTALTSDLQHENVCKFHSFFPPVPATSVASVVTGLSASEHGVTGCMRLPQQQQREGQEQEQQHSGDNHQAAFVPEHLVLGHRNAGHLSELLDSGSGLLTGGLLQLVGAATTLDDGLGLGLAKHQRQPSWDAALHALGPTVHSGVHCVTSQSVFYSSVVPFRDLGVLLNDEETDPEAAAWVRHALVDAARGDVVAEGDRLVLGRALISVLRGTVECGSAISSILVPLRNSIDLQVLCKASSVLEHMSSDHGKRSPLFGTGTVLSHLPMQAIHALDEDHPLCALTLSAVDAVLYAMHVDERVALLVTGDVALEGKVGFDTTKPKVLDLEAILGGECHLSDSHVSLPASMGPETNVRYPYDGYAQASSFAYVTCSQANLNIVKRYPALRGRVMDALRKVEGIYTVVPSESAGTNLGMDAAADSAAVGDIIVIAKPGYAFVPSLSSSRFCTSSADVTKVQEARRTHVQDTLDASFPKTALDAICKSTDLYPCCEAHLRGPVNGMDTSQMIVGIASSRLPRPVRNRVVLQSGFMGVLAGAAVGGDEDVDGLLPPVIKSDRLVPGMALQGADPSDGAAFRDTINRFEQAGAVRGDGPRSRRGRKYYNRDE